MKNPSGMKTGSMPSTSVNREVNAKNKHSRLVNAADLMAQGESKARMNRMDLGSAPVRNVDQDCEYN